MKHWLKKNRYPIIIALGLVVFEVFWWLFSLLNAGPDRVWLGNDVMDPGDWFVYLNNIEQIRHGAWGLQNLFAPGVQFPYWHPFYVAVGWFARLTGLPGGPAHELCRIAAVIAAVFLLHHVSRRVLCDEKRATWATLMIIFCGGMGWLSVMLQIFKWYKPLLNLIPDINAETNFFPTLLKGGHILLSWSLLVFASFHIWQTIATNGTKRQLVAGLIATLVLGIIHPYALLTIAILIIIATVFRLVKTRQFTLSRLWLFALSGLLASSPHIYGTFLNPSRRFLLAENYLPLEPRLNFLLCLLPWIIFLAIRWWKKIDLRPQEYWLIAWAAAMVIAIALPFKWDRKLTEGLSAIFIYLSYPVIELLYERVFLRLTLPMVALGIMFCLSSLCMIKSEVDWIVGVPGQEDIFYASYDLEKSWQYIKDATPSQAVVLTEDALVGTQTTAFTLRHVYFGHSCETPDFENKYAQVRTLLADMPVDQARTWLEQNNISVVLSTYPYRAKRWEELLDRSWMIQNFGTVTVYQKMTDISTSVSSTKP